jgi:uncharacterized membrane protein
MAKITGKEWWLSRTIWVAVAQAVLGIIGAILVANPEIKIAGGLLMIKSIIDILLRLDTNRAIK